MKVVTIGKTAQHRGSIEASQPAVLGLNLTDVEPNSFSKSITFVWCQRAQRRGKKLKILGIGVTNYQPERFQKKPSSIAMLKGY